MRRFKQLMALIVRRFGFSHERFEVTDVNDALSKYQNAWLSSSFPSEQWRIVESQLARLRQGNLSPEFATFADAITMAIECRPGCRSELLEIGCSSGYYGEVLKIVAPTFRYVGVDFSDSFISFGREKFPHLDLRSGDATSLPFEQRAFDIVLSGCVLLHVFRWQVGVAETCRVARSFIILHRTPVSTAETILFTKTAYGEKMIEWTFNEQELLEEFAKHGFEMTSKWPVYPGNELGNDASHPTQFTYLLIRM